MWLPQCSCVLSVLVYFPVYGYVICDHMRAVHVYMSALNGSCQLTGVPCSSYEDFLKGSCVDCDVFKGKCPVIGNGTPWREQAFQTGSTGNTGFSFSSLPSLMLKETSENQSEHILIAGFVTHNSNSSNTLILKMRQAAKMYKNFHL